MSEKHENCQKIKLLKLMELLQQETDEGNPMRTTELCRRLGTIGISCDRKTLGRDIKLLNEQGFEIMSVFAGHEKAYYIADRSFSIPEIKLLMDAVQAASFVTEKKTRELTEKITALGGSHGAEILRSNMVCFNTRKHNNEAVYYSIDALENAISQGRKASFFYFDLGENKERIYRKDRERYVVEPIALVYHEDNYYLMCYSEKYEGICNYRVDRMDRVSTEDTEICRLAREYKDEISGYVVQMFKMYIGKPENVVLGFDNALIGVVYDKFGEDTAITRIDQSTCKAELTIQLSPLFWGWVFQFGGKMRIIAPSSAVNGFKEALKQFDDER